MRTEIDIKREMHDINCCLELYGSELGEASISRKYKRLYELREELDKLENL